MRTVIAFIVAVIIVVAACAAIGWYIGGRMDHPWWGGAAGVVSGLGVVALFVWWLANNLRITG